MRTDNSPLADRLQTAAPEDRARLKDQFVAGLRDELDALVGVLRGKDDQLAGTRRIDPASGEYHAVEVLQFARYAPAADLFVRHLDARSTAFPTMSDEAQVDFRFFPFALAASAVGTPAVAALTGAIGTADVGTTRYSPEPGNGPRSIEANALEAIRLR